MEAARICAQNNFFAVLSNDSDYLVFDIPGYMPLEKFSETTAIGLFIQRQDFSYTLSSHVRNALKVVEDEKKKIALEHPETVDYVPQEPPNAFNSEWFPDLAVISGCDFYDAVNISHWRN